MDPSRPWSPTRRWFLAAASSVASAGWMLPRSVWALPPGYAQPAPLTPPPSAARADAILAASPLPADEPIARAAVEAAMAAGATFAEARLVRYRQESTTIRDDHVEAVVRSDEYGIGVRVIAEGGWGYAASGVVDLATAKRLAKQAVDTAKRSGGLLSQLGRDGVVWAPNPVQEGQWVAPHEVDPLGVPVQDKAGLLLEASRELLKVPGVAHAQGGLHVVVEDKLYVSSEGARIHQIVPRVAPDLTAIAVDARRNRFASRSHEAPAMQAGWEYITELDLRGDAAKVGAEAVQKLYAKPVEPGQRQIVLAPSNLWLTIHESIGHPTELDRAMGYEADFAGTSFIGPKDAGRLKIGSSIVDLVADRTQPGGLATVGWDDDGVVPSRWPIVQDGVFVGWQTTRDQAAWIGEEQSRGTSYGQGYRGMPFQRMPNISLQPGAEGYTTEDLINATEDGIYITGRGSWSIDQQRYNFQFGGQMFWEIKRGRITQPLRDVAYQANTIEFWHSCDMLGGEGTYRLHGTFGDGKGQPMQLNAVSHGCPPARFTAQIVNTGDER